MVDHLLQSHPSWLDKALVDLFPVSHLRKIALSLGENFKEFSFHLLARHLLSQLDGPCRMLKNDERLQTGHVGKKPTAARVHLQGVSLHLNNFEASNLPTLIETLQTIPFKEPHPFFARTSEDDIDIPVSRSPDIFKYLLTLFFEKDGQVIS